MYAKRHYFTASQDQFIRTSARNGIKCSSVAADLKRRDSVVRKRAKALGTPFPPTGKAWNKPGRAKARLFSKEQDQIIRILAHRGWNSREVSERIGRNDGSIRLRAKVLGVEFIPNGGRSWVGYLTSELRAS